MHGIGAEANWRLTVRIVGSYRRFQKPAIEDWALRSMQLNENTVLPDRDRLAFRNNADSKHDAATCRNPHITADYGIGSNVGPRMNDWLTFVMG